MTAVTQLLTDRPRSGGLGTALGALVVLGAALALAACGGSDDRLTIYSGRSDDLVAPLLDEFEAESGIEIEVRYGDTAELAATLIEEGGNSPADVFFGQDAGALGALEKEGLLAKLPSSDLAKVEPRFRSPTGHWVGTSGRARVIAYDGRELSESDLPASILDFTDPKWKGRLGWAPTNGSFQAFVTALRLLEGEEVAAGWLEGIVANDVTVFDNNIAVRDAIAAGEIDVGFINHYYVAEAVAEEGPDYPVKLYFPPGGDPGSLINVAGAAVLESSAMSAEAEEFISYLLAPSSQRFFARDTKEYPLIEGVAADPAVVPLDEIQHPALKLGELDDLRGTLDLLERTGAL